MDDAEKKGLAEELAALDDHSLCKAEIKRLKVEITRLNEAVAYAAKLDNAQEDEIAALKADNFAHCTALMTTQMWMSKEEEVAKLKADLERCDSLKNSGLSYCYWRDVSVPKLQAELEAARAEIDLAIAKLKFIPEFLNYQSDEVRNSLCDWIKAVEDAASWARFHIEERGKQDREEAAQVLSAIFEDAPGRAVRDA